MIWVPRVPARPARLGDRLSLATCGFLRIRRGRFALIAFGIAFGTAALPLLLSAQPASMSDDEVAKVCGQVQFASVPQSLFPTPAEIATLPKDCSPINLYYTLEDPARLTKARGCGLAKWQKYLDSIKHDEDSTPPMENAEFLALAMLYSNGEGVQKNPALARKFVCANDSDWVEVGSILSVIAAGKTLDVCSANYGRWPDFICLGRDQGRVNQELNSEKAQIRSRLPANAQTAFDKLLSAYQDFRDAHETEKEPTGNMNTGAVQAHMAEDLEDDRKWSTVLKAVAAGGPPAGVAAASAFAKQDADLNKAYAEWLKDAIDSDNQSDCEFKSGQNRRSCPNQASLRKAELAWLRYREAWVNFGALVWPEIPADHWRAWLTEQRLEDH